MGRGRLVAFLRAEVLPGMAKRGRSALEGLFLEELDEERNVDDGEEGRNAGRKKRIGRSIMVGGCCLGRGDESEVGCRRARPCRCAKLDWA